MATLIKKGRKKPAAEAAAPETAAEAPASTDVVAVGGTEAQSTSEPAPQRGTVRYAKPTYDAAATYTPPEGAGDFQLPQRYLPAEPAPLPPPDTGSGSLLQRALMFTGEQTAAERDRQAALDWEQAMAPVMDLMRGAIPEASTPEEAARILAENQGEITPDPAGGAYVNGDGFDRDARVYYRLLRRDYEKYPRPSERNKRPVSHHLHQVYGKLVGTKGW
ncbi:MAG TPA: hypothetical protein VHT97_12200 [Acidimicrobiales bacterium]|jgi:hypothetical protein|nr:hypothetical protein [Acidimicrobiales bacterium]